MSLEKAFEFMKLKTAISGVGVLTETSEKFNEDVLMVDFNQVKVYIPRSEISIHPVKNSLIKYIGQRVEYLIIGVNEAEGFTIGSCKALQEIKFQQFIDQIESGKLDQFEAEIVGLMEYGARMEYNGIQMILNNIHFSNDYTRVEDIHRVGDCINVRVIKIQDFKVSIEAVEKYQAKAYLSFAEFVPGDIVVGVVRTIRESTVYVHLMTSIDGMAAIKEWIPVEKGDVVRFKVNQVREDGRIRGRILQNLTKNPDQGEEEQVISC